MAFTSQRENRGNLFRYDLDDGRIDLKTRGRPRGCVSAANHALYLWQGRKIIELKLDARAERVVFEYDGGWRLPVFSHAGRISLDKPADFNRWGAANAKPFIQLFRWNRQHYVGPKILAYHRSTFNDQYAHCHPRFTPDGKSVLYTSDLTSYAKYVSGGNRRL